MAKPFEFAVHAEGFDSHIEDSIPGLSDLRKSVTTMSRRFIQPETSVIDMGCSAGTMLRAVRDANQPEVPSVEYIGVDIEPKFQKHWTINLAGNLRFRVGDVRQQEFHNTSLTISLFTLQFIPESDRLSVLKRIYDGLVEGGALIISEKVLAESALFQDMFSFDYYDFKRQAFSPKQILDKERGLRRQMHLWSEKQLLEALREAGFHTENPHRFWQKYLFVGIVAVKKVRSTKALKRRAA